MHHWFPFLIYESRIPNHLQELLLFRSDFCDWFFVCSKWRCHYLFYIMLITWKKERSSLSSFKTLHVRHLFIFIMFLVIFPLIASCSFLLSQKVDWLSTGRALCKPSGGFPVWHLLERTAFQEGAVCCRRRAPDRRSWNGKPGFPRAC